MPSYQVEDFAGSLSPTSIPGGLKKAIDWASRPWGQNSFHHVSA